MHGILALSARHISISTQISPERSRHYLNQSTKLQTWAVTNFNPAPPKPSQDTCVALFLFSSLICIHGLADIALLDLDPENFLIRFGHYFELQRGVRTIVGNYWSRLEESKIQQLLQWCELATLRKGQGSECDSIRQLVAQSADLSPEAIEACHLAIEQLQCVLDGCGPHQSIPVHCVYLTLAWPLLVPEKLVDLLVLRRPAALIILAYYGVTLDLCRNLWVVGHAGKNIVHAINVDLLQQADKFAVDLTYSHQIGFLSLETAAYWTFFVTYSKVFRPIMQRHVDTLRNLNLYDSVPGAVRGRLVMHPTLRLCWMQCPSEAMHTPRFAP
ncbi:hypothetical protein E0Z10_g5150 [Xylaria hypoxylon]|uniref:Uncharacterized protein n=1 Tax=Xylaria hypoxylon TaxID=37992 RepID=A0A4Z0YW62_9PEZI|nr:hypothetical protein E0Z10_g5150 [Xylaria hypoxylon]